MFRYLTIGMVGAFWGPLGVAVLLGSAIYRLAPAARSALASDISWYHWVFLVLVLAFMAYAEGFRAFQQAFSPRVAARARYLKGGSNPVHAVFAPLFCMGYFHAPKRRRISSISVTAGIVVLVILVRLLPQPWRGMVDAGVVVGLAWGLISLVIFTVRAFTSKEFDYSPEVPDQVQKP